MIQRIQSVFLFASLCFLVPMFFFPVAELIFPTNEILTFNLMGFYKVKDGVTAFHSQPWLMAFGILICALNLVTIFMFKRRVLQLRLCVYNILLLIGLTGVMLYVWYSAVEPVSGQFPFRLPAVFPIISLILHYLAFRGIRKDELMVQALSRLR